jgi:hypothetical protein
MLHKATLYLSILSLVNGFSTRQVSQTTTKLFASTATTSNMAKPYGTWPSPITSKAITAGSVKLGGVHYHNNQVYWLEGRPQEGGRNVLVKYDPSSIAKSERNGVDVSPKESNVRTRVHEYGGGAVVFGKEQIYYSDFATQRLCKLSDGMEVTTGENCIYRFADGVTMDDDSTIVCVREDHTNPKPSEVVNEVVAVTVDNGSIKVLATGNDFYSAPRLSPDGKQLAYVTWNHPNMPWDASELRVTSLDSSNKSKDHDLIAGQDGDTSIIQPLWHPKNGDLYYISDQSGYYNIYRAGYPESVLPMDYDFGGSAPGW